MTSKSEDRPDNGMMNALRLATVGNKTAIEMASLNAQRKERLFLKAILDQFDGDVTGAIRSLKHQMKSLLGLDKAIVADFLAPMLMMRHENESIGNLASIISDAGLRASAYSLRAVLAADRKQRTESLRHIARSQFELESEVDESVRLRVLQRLGRASLLNNDFERALDFAATGAALSLQLGSAKAAAANYSVSYNIHHAITGQFDEARRFARLCYEQGALCSDASFMQSAAVAEYEMAVQFADLKRVEVLEHQIQSVLLPQQYCERFAFAFSYALTRGAEDPTAMRTLLGVANGSPRLSDGQRSACVAFIAIADASQMDDDHARLTIREAISLLGRPSKTEPAHEIFIRRVARAAIATACIFIGDDVRADRLLAVGELRDVGTFRQVAQLVRDRSWADFAPELKGIARVFRLASEQREAQTPATMLTQAEMGVLTLLGRGWSAGRIAYETQRSVNTVYNHTRSILGKLEAKRAAEAVAIARERGILN